MQRRVLLPAALLLVVALAWVVRARGDRPEASGARAAERPTAPSAAPRLQGHPGANAAPSEPPAGAPAPPSPPEPPGAWVGKTLRGRVVFPDGTPAAHAHVELGSLAREGVSRMMLSTIPQADADQNGGFEIPQLDPALYAILIEADREGRDGRYFGEVEPGQGEVVFRLQEGRERLRVHVLDPDGVPAPSASAHLVVEDRGAYAFASGGVARFLAFGDEPRQGPATLVVELFYDELEANERPWAPTVIEGIDPATREVTVRAERGGLIAGRIEDATPDLNADAAARGAAGRTVVASVDGGGIRRWFSQRETTVGADGRFRFEAMAAGAWRLHVRGAFLSEASQVERAQVGDLDVVLQLLATASARVRVVDPTGRPVRVARVWCSQSDWGTAESTIKPADDGVARLDGLRAGLVGSLGATSDDGGRWRGYLPVWLPSDTTLTLEPVGAGRVEGVVRDVAGAPVPEVIVYARQGKRASTTRASDVGRFRFDELEAGPVTLEARLGSGPGAADGTSAASSGDVDVRLVVDLGQRLHVVVENWPYAADREGATLVEEGNGPTAGAVLPALAFTYAGILFAGLRSDATYTLFVRAPGTDYFARLTGVRAGEDRSIRLGPGTSLRGRVLFSGGSGGAGAGSSVEGARQIEVRGRALGVPVEGTVASDGQYTIDALPFGTRVEVTATAVSPDGTRLIARALGTAGGEQVDLTLAP